MRPSGLSDRKFRTVIDPRGVLLRLLDGADRPRSGPLHRRHDIPNLPARSPSKSRNEVIPGRQEITGSCLEPRSPVAVVDGQWYKGVVHIRAFHRPYRNALVIKWGKTQAVPIPHTGIMERCSNPRIRHDCKVTGGEDTKILVENGNSGFTVPQNRPWPRIGSEKHHHSGTCRNQGIHLRLNQDSQLIRVDRGRHEVVAAGLKCH